MREQSVRGQVAPRVVLHPAGSSVPPLPAGWIALAQLPPEPGRPRVFGDGSHATTRLCAAVVDLLCRRSVPRAVLDVGTGTGVLARIARARGATFVMATDIDPAALASAAAHAALDVHAVEIQVALQPPDHWGPRFDVVVANILEAPLISLVPALRAALAPDGVVLISGFTRPQGPRLRVVYASAGLTLAGESYIENWGLLAFRRARMSHRPDAAATRQTAGRLP